MENAEISPALPTRRFHVEARGGGLVLRVRVVDRARILHAGLWALRVGVAALGAVPFLFGGVGIAPGEPPRLYAVFAGGFVLLILAGLMWELRYGAYTGPVHRLIERTFALPAGVGEAAGYRGAEPVFRVDGREIHGPGARLVVVRLLPRPVPSSELERSYRFVVCVALAGALFRLETFRTEPDARQLAERLATLLGAAHDPAVLPEESPLPPGFRIQLAGGLHAVLAPIAIVIAALLLVRPDQPALAWPAVCIGFPLVEWGIERLVVRRFARREAEQRAEAILRQVT